MEPRPKIKIELSVTERLLEVSGWLILSLLWIITLFNYKNLPDTIPTHFNAAGNADDYGSSSTIFFLPSIGTIIFIGLTILNRFPHIFNYPVKITTENAQKQYTLATRLIRVLKLSLSIIFTIIVWSISYAATEGTGKLGIWFIPVMLLIIFLPLGYYIFKSFRNK